MSSELRGEVTRGVAWGVGEKIGTTLLQIGVRIVVLRLLMPDDLGVMAILLSFSTIAQVMVDSGFSQTLIRKAAPTATDYKSVFVFNVVAATVLYFLLVAISPWVAAYYQMPIITQIAPVYYLVLPANALCVIQNTLFVRQFRFPLLSKITFGASLIGGLAAVAMAVAGCGVWSLVAQLVVSMVARAAMLWRSSDWRPRAAGSSAALREMAPYSLSLLTTDLISAFYNKIPQFFIGKRYSSDTLGYFDQAQKLKDLPVNSTMLAVQGVTFPALSKISGDEPKFAESYRQVLLVTAYVMFPMMLGMSAVATDLFAVLLGDRWMPTVPYFKVICLAGLFTPLAMVAYNVLKVRCAGRTIVQLEIVKKIVMTLIFALTIPRGVQAVVWGLVAMAFCEMTVNLVASLRYTTLCFGRVVRTLLPVAAVSGAMYTSVRLAAQVLLPGHMMLRLATEVAVGVAVYLLLSALFRLEAFHEVVSLAREQFAKLRASKQ